MLPRPAVAFFGATRVSRLGLVLAGSYLLLSAVSIAWGFSVENVEARKSFILQLPLLPALVLFGVAWVAAVACAIFRGRVAFGVIIPVIAAALYGLGSLVGRLSVQARLVAGCVVLLVATVATMWPLRR